MLFYIRQNHKVSIFYQKSDGTIVHGKYYFQKQEGPFWEVKNRIGKTLTFDRSDKQLWRGWDLSERKVKKAHEHIQKMNGRNPAPPQLEMPKDKLDEDPLEKNLKGKEIRKAQIREQELEEAIEERRKLELKQIREQKTERKLDRTVNESFINH